MSDLREVLVVERAPSVRSFLRRVLADVPDIVVLGEAEHPEQAREMVRRLKPDLVILGLDPSVSHEEGKEFDCVDFLDARVPILVLTPPMTGNNHSCREGLTLVAKPTVPEGWRQLSAELPSMVRNLTAGERLNASRANPTGTFRFVAIGASAGGPTAVRTVLETAGSALDHVGIGIVQHIGEGFEEGLVGMLAASLQGRSVGLAVDSEVLAPGAVRIAPPGSHMTIAGDGRISLDALTPPEDGHRPSINSFFRSLERGCAGATIAILLSGMGDDGAAGLYELRVGGALCLVQDPATCTVDGMPQAALRLGAAESAMAPEGLGRRLVEALTGAKG